VRLLRPCLPQQHSAGPVLPLRQAGDLGPEKERQKADLARERFEFRQLRQEREEQEKAERLARKKAALARKDPDQDTKTAIDGAIERARAKRSAQSNEEASPADRERADG
jgi:Na+-translocating ferredoxin:NAD+ oxidoreductase subunit C